MKKYVLGILYAWFGFAVVAAAQPEEGDVQVGLLKRDPGATAGYTLMSPAQSTETYLIDLDGRIVNQWSSARTPGMSVYLLENGNLLRAGAVGFMGNGTFRAGGAGGALEEYDWEGNLVWSYLRDSDQHLSHHDVEVLPNGNILMLSYDRVSREDAIAAGRNPEAVEEAGLWPDSVIEVKPIRPEGGEIVWEWHVWDHLVQDLDSSLPNFGAIAENAHRININPPDWTGQLSDEQLEELEALGYLGGDEPSPEADSEGSELENTLRSLESLADWNHLNTVAYNAELNQIMLSSYAFSELWIIDHSTTTAEAKGSSGGRWGRGGDLLYRAGNPSVHGSSLAEQSLFSQHNTSWVADAESGAGTVFFFNNGRNRPDGDYSSADEIRLPQSKPGVYATDESGQFLPPELVWTYGPREEGKFYSPMISGAQRLASGNSLICSGAEGRLIEVTASGEVVWEYVLPLTVAQPPAGAPAARPPGIAANIIFRADRYAPDFVGFRGKSMDGGETIEAATAK